MQATLKKCRTPSAECRVEQAEASGGLLSVHLQSAICNLQFSALPCWELHTPELRYDVASLQHWLDLNG